MKFLAGAVQLDAILGKVTENLCRAEHYIQKAAKAGVKLLVLPELFSTGYDLKNQTARFAETEKGPTPQFLLQMAKKYGLHLTGSYIEKSRGKPFNTALLVGPKGFIGKHRKVNLWGNEQRYFKPGNSFKVFKTELGVMGILICYDADFPESARALALQGAEILLFPTAGTVSFSMFYGNFIASRAFENGCFLIQANRMGKEGDFVYAGFSRVINPQGIVLVDAKKQERFIATEIDLSLIQQQRQKAPYLKEFKGKIYKKYF
ncbi:MAG: carbon-nitrogen hydrolase family protein [Candidatus Gracilibacteria bacterium]|jgi:predicted amidohydrolase